jgi:hypothetical protein
VEDDNDLSDNEIDDLHASNYHDGSHSCVKMRSIADPHPVPSTELPSDSRASSGVHEYIKLGGQVYKRNWRTIYQLVKKQLIWISPNGIMFVKKQNNISTAGHASVNDCEHSHQAAISDAIDSVEGREGVLPRMLYEILQARNAVKREMNRPHVKNNKALWKLYNARQFSLKLIANVTYGYTSASFSGRMPCAEIADAIVQSGRDTLEKAIRMIESQSKWGAKVVYGDTDSLFVLVEGRTKSQAFQIGEEIVRAVCESNPAPVELIMEKIYHPCALVSKKRYVGFMYEHKDQAAPTLDCKGLEIVRRDQCPLTCKVLEDVVRALFTTHDISQVRCKVEDYFRKIMNGKIPLEDYIFSKEVRMGSYRVMPNAALVGSKLASVDHRLSPLYYERMPYVVIEGEPRATLRERCVPPQLVCDGERNMRICYSYYITKHIIPSCKRVLDVVGYIENSNTSLAHPIPIANINEWYERMGRVDTHVKSLPPFFRTGKTFSKAFSSAFHSGTHTTNSYRFDNTAVKQTTINYSASVCSICRAPTKLRHLLCGKCLSQPQLSLATSMTNVNRIQSRYQKIADICHECTNCLSSGIRKQIQLNAQYTINKKLNSTFNTHPGQDMNLLPDLSMSITDIECISLDCPIYFERSKLMQELNEKLQIAINCAVHASTSCDSCKTQISS